VRTYLVESSGLWTGWHQLQSQSLAELGRRSLTINLCSCDRNSVQSVIVCYHSPHHGVEHHVKQRHVNAIMASPNPKRMWACWSGFPIQLSYGIFHSCNASNAELHVHFASRSPLTLTLNGSCSQFGCSKEACFGSAAKNLRQQAQEYH